MLLNQTQLDPPWTPAFAGVTFYSDNVIADVIPAKATEGSAHLVQESHRKNYC